MCATAFMFPGQGSQYVGMGRDLYESSPAARAVFQNADEILGTDLSRVCFEGPEEALRQTRCTQPAIFVHSVALLTVLGDGSAPATDGVAFTAGHSLGEYSALVASGALSFEEGLDLVRVRSEAMQQAGEENPGAMAAIVGLSDEEVESLCAEAAAEGIVQPANFNAPGQVIISGSIPGVMRAVELAKSHGARLAKELSVSGAFHSPLMLPARDPLWAALSGATIRDARIPVVANVTAQPVTDAEEIRTLLDRQLVSPVLWLGSMQKMVAEGVTTFVEIGPGRVLQGLLKRIAPEATAVGIDTPHDVEMFMKRVS